MNQVINFELAKKRFVPSVIHVGDLVEWMDYDGQVYEGVVKAIEHQPLEGYGVGKKLDCFPLWEKEEYTVYFNDGLSIAGSAVTEKVIRKGSKVKKPFYEIPYAN